MYYSWLDLPCFVDFCSLEEYKRVDIRQYLHMLNNSYLIKDASKYNCKKNNTNQQTVLCTKDCTYTQIFKHRIKNNKSCLN